MARRDAGLHEGRRGRQGQRRLGDEIVGVVLHLLGEGGHRCLVGSRSDQHAVAAGAGDLLDHQLGHVVEHIGERFGFATAPGRHVLQNLVLAKIEADDLRHVGVDRLVVGDAGADRIGQRDVARAIGIHDARYAEGGVGAEGEGIEEIRRLGGDRSRRPASAPRWCACRRRRRAPAGRGPRPARHRACPAREGVLVIGAVERPGGEQGNRRLVRRRMRRHRLQGGQQLFGIVFDRGDRVEGEEIGEQPHHHFAVLEHVGDARGRAGIVSRT